MKMQLLFLLFGLTFIHIKAQCINNVNIPDANFKASLLNDHNIDTDNNGEISCVEAAAFTGTIEVDNKNISDLTGIETFVNLNRLDCFQNQLTSLDLSSNTKLELLLCRKNQLTSLTLPNNPAFHYLSCYENQITSLDISNNTSLRTLLCNDNLLTSLDVSNNIMLQVFSCFENELGSLDVTNNTNLTVLQCQYNQLPSLDVSTNTNLRTFLCNDNQLKNLNMSNGNNGAIIEFNATTNPDLTCIQVDDISFANTNWSSKINAVISFSTDCSSLGLSNSEHTNFNLSQIYPNPVSSILNIEINSPINTLEVYMLTGEKVKDAKLSSVIDVSQLQSGVYLLKIEDRNGVVLMDTFLKTNEL